MGKCPPAGRPAFTFKVPNMEAPGGSRIFVVHGPCPDGLAARALLEMATSVTQPIAILEQAHGRPHVTAAFAIADAAATVTKRLSEVVYIDICPSEEIVAAVLALPEVKLTVLDHHVSEHDDMVAIARTHPGRVFFTYGEGHVSGVVLARQWIESLVPTPVPGFERLCDEVVTAIAEADTPSDDERDPPLISRVTKSMDKDALVGALTSNRTELALLKTFAQAIERDDLEVAATVFEHGGLIEKVTRGEDVEEQLRSVSAFVTQYHDHRVHNDVARKVWFSTEAQISIMVNPVAVHGGIFQVSVRVRHRAFSQVGTAQTFVNIAKERAGCTGGGHLGAGGFQPHASKFAKDGTNNLDMDRFRALIMDVLVRLPCTKAEA